MSPPRPIWTPRFREAGALLASVRDIVGERPSSVVPPAWCEARRWTAWLADLSDEEVSRAERHGLGALLDDASAAPLDLVDLAACVRRATALPSRESPQARVVRGEHTSARKREQIAAFAQRVESFGAPFERVVDIGSGHGHLTRHLAEAFSIRAEGWERDPARIARARTLAADREVTFRSVDVLHDVVHLDARDLVVGLHACGDLGDRAVRLARNAGASVVIVGCCPQKRAGERAPLARLDPIAATELTLPHSALGLANVRDGEDGIEADLATRIRARVQRMALRSLFETRGLLLAPGEEMRGVNRRHATHRLHMLVDKAFSSRALASPSAADIERAERDAWNTYARVRRWSLPRDLLARLVEVFVALDRAAHLEDAGYACDVDLVFASAVSPRNIAVSASRPP